MAIEETGPRLGGTQSFVRFKKMMAACRRIGAGVLAERLIEAVQQSPGISGGSLQKKLGIDWRELGVLADELEAHGLIERQEVPLSLTDAGRGFLTFHYWLDAGGWREAGAALNDFIAGIRTRLAEPGAGLSKPALAAP